jgi:hypothetical protein
MIRNYILSGAFAGPRALSSYSLFAKWLLNKDIGIVPLDAPEIVSKLEKLNQKTWSIR